MLPKFLIADNSQESEDRIYIVHTQSPRCIIESDIEDFNKDRRIHWNDAAVTGASLEKLIESAEVFLENELVNQEDLYDAEFND